MVEQTPLAAEKTSNSQSGYNFGTFQGVYTPSLLTILGVIMYLRFGWVLGHVGLIQTLLIVTLSTAITAITALSISAMATNMHVGRGGAYHIISRSLGVEAGGAVGLPLFLAQAFSISFYVLGFSEAVIGLFPFLPERLIGLVALAVLTFLAYVSADLALRVQFFILILILSSLVSFFVGGPPQTLTISASPDILPRETFWSVFAVFFPAVTGIQAGLSLSGDLKDPAKSLPLGTLGAVLTSFVIYLAIPIFLSRVVTDANILITNPLILRDVARWGDLILFGLWGASLSSCLGMLLGAPRTLQALAQDGVVPRILGKSFGPRNEPRVALAVSCAIGVWGIWAGGLNVIATLLTMFFLTSYGLLNLCAAFEEMIGSPSWRPQFRVSWRISLLGAFGSLAVMFMISPGATFVASFASFGVYFLLRRKRLKNYWGDLRYGILMLCARFALYRLTEREPEERTWRPNILVLSASPTSGWHLIALANAISYGSGFLTVAAVFPKEKVSADRITSLRQSIYEYLKKRRVSALVKIHPAEDVLEGIRELVDVYGFGPVVPNTILLGETEKEKNLDQYVALIQRIHQMRRNLVMVREGENDTPSFQNARIDVWWGRVSQNANLMLALAYLLHKSPDWSRSELVLRTIIDDEKDREESVKGLEDFVAKGRLGAKIEVIVKSEKNIFDIIRTHSKDAGLVFLGMRLPKEDEPLEMYRMYYENLIRWTEGLPSTALVLAAEEIEFDQIFAPTLR